MTDTTRRIAIGAVAAGVVVTAVIYLGTLLGLGQTTLSWPGPRSCRAGKCLGSPGPCRAFDGCVNDICQESLTGNAECAPGWSMEAPDETGQRSLAICSPGATSTCEWQPWSACGRAGQPCCSAVTAVCDGTLSCRGGTCRAP